MTHNNRRGFTSAYFLYLLFVMVFFGWHIFYFFPFLLLILWMPLFTFDWHEVEEEEKPKRKPKDDSYYM